MRVVYTGESVEVLTLPGGDRTSSDTVSQLSREKSPGALVPCDAGRYNAIQRTGETQTGGLGQRRATMDAMLMLACLAAVAAIYWVGRYGNDE